MGSTFEGNMTEANEELLDEYGEPVTYTPKGGSPISVSKASVGPVEGDMIGDEYGGTLSKNRRITVPIAEVSSPGIDDIVTVGAEDWIVTGIINICSGIAELQCRWNEMQSKHHEMHKRKISQG